MRCCKLTNSHTPKTHGFCHHRMGSAVVRDVDNMQRHNQLKVEELTTALNKSEQSRREMELIIAADKAREEVRGR